MILFSPLQLLDLMHTLHTRAASIFSSFAEEDAKQQGPRRSTESLPEGLGDPIDAEVSTLWRKCWCPLLQGKTSCYESCA